MRSAAKTRESGCQRIVLVLSMGFFLIAVTAVAIGVAVGMDIDDEREQDYERGHEDGMRQQCATD